MIDFMGLEHHGRILGMIWTVGIVLAFDRHSVVIVIDAATLAFGAAVKPVASVYLDSGLGGGYGKRAAAAGTFEDSGSLELTGSVTVYEPAGIVALAILEGGEILVNVFAKAFGIEEIHGSAGDGLRFS